MPFDDLETVHKDNQPPTAKVSYQPFDGRPGKKPAEERKPRLTITIPTTICGISKAGRFKALIGTGVDAGTIRVVGIKGSKKDDSKVGGVAPTEHQHFLKFNFGHVPAWGDEKIAPADYPVTKVDDDTFDIDVPKSWTEDAAKIQKDARAAKAAKGK